MQLLLSYLFLQFFSLRGHAALWTCFASLYRNRAHWKDRGVPLLCGRWMLEMQRTEGKADQTKVLKQFLRAGDTRTMFRNFASLLMILMATPSNTSSLERSYTHSELVCAPRRSKLSPKNIKNLYLLAMLKLTVKGSGEYIREIKYLEKTLSFSHIY